MLYKIEDLTGSLSFSSQFSGIKLQYNIGASGSNSFQIITLNMFLSITC